MVTAPNLTPRQVRKLAAQEGDIEAYAKAVHNLDVEPYQLAWEEALENEDRIAIICPPDTFKSTTVQYVVERRIGKNKNSRTLWLMNTGEQASKRIMAVARTIEQNPVFNDAFNIHKGDQWTNTVLYVDRDIDSPDPTLMATGLNGPYQGFHFDHIVIDDPTDQEDVRSPTTMELQRNKIRGVVLDRLVEGGKIVVILTRWGEDDLIPMFKEIGFKIITMPLVADYPWGPTISNKRFPMPRVEQMRIEKGDAMFNLTYMCNPLALQGSGPIKREDIKYWNKDTIPENATLTLMTVDPAASIQHWADPSAIAMGLLDPRNRATYVTDVIAGRWGAERLEEEIVKRAKQTAGLVGIGVETIGFQMSLMQRWRKEYNLPFKELPYRTRRQAMNVAHGLDRDKANRAIYLGSKFISNQIFLPPYKLPLVDGVSVEAELLSFPNGAHDDRLDVLAFLCAMADAYSRRGGRVRLVA